MKELPDDTLLLAMGDWLTREIRASELLGHVIDVMASLLEAERGTLFLLDRGAEELVSVAAHLPEMGEIRVPLSQGVAGHVARTGNFVNVPYCEEDQRFWAKVDETTGFQTRTMLAGPLYGSVGDTELIGVVQILNKREGIFDERDQERFRRLAGQAAAILEQTTLNSRAVGAGINGVIGCSPAMQEVIEDVKTVAPTDATVLLRGESGTGKGLFAKAIHENSSRRDGPMVTVDCTTLPEGLMESELFGHERGAFTGAYQKKIGKVEAADGGTLFLDEIGDLPAELQGKLLTLLQDQSYSPVGATGRRRADLRILAATNRPLEELVRDGKFREDLYYRLKVVELVLPPLRERSREDVRLLVDHFVARAARRHGRLGTEVRDDAMALLLEYEWPGNVRELSNCLESAVIFSDGLISPSKLSLPRADATTKVRSLRHRGGGGGWEDEPSLAELERRYIDYLLERHEGNRSACARVLGVGRNTLLRKIREYGLE